MNSSIKQSNAFDFIVVGAGISGIYAAYELKNRGFSVLIIEKSKSVGGRMATRRLGQYKIDHGAQFVDLNQPDFSGLDKELTDASIVFPWFVKNDKWMKAAKNGITQIPNFLASNLDIVFSERVTQIAAEERENLVVSCENQTHYFAKHVILSCPLPQSLKILDDSNLIYPTSLGQISYASSIVALFALEKPPQKLSHLMHLENLTEEIHSISNQQSKQVSDYPAFSMVMSPDWSQKNFEKDEFELTVILKEKFIKQIGWSESRSFSEIQIKKWKFSHPNKIFDKPFFSFYPERNVYLIGDAFGGGSVKGALKSAHAVVKHLLHTK